MIILMFSTGSILICKLIVAVLPVMLSSKLLPEMETDDNMKREQLLCGIANLPVTMQIEKLKVIYKLLLSLYSIWIRFFVLSPLILHPNHL